MSHSVRLIAVTLAGVGALSVAVASPALADPPSSHKAITIAGVGSDTTQDVMNAMATAYDSSGAAGYVASWNAFPPGATMPNPNATIVTKPGCAAITRPAGSSAGIAALLNDSSGKCIDFARSSRAKKTDGTEDSLSFYAYGRDGVTWATHPQVSGSPARTPTSMTAAQLKSIYTCSVKNWHSINSSLPSNTIRPYLPQAGSGTRSFFETAIGITDAQIGSCVNQNVIENDGRTINKDSNAVVPYSIAKWISQKEKVGGLTDITGGTVLRQISAVAPTVGATGKLAINPKFPPVFLRLIYNVAKNTNPLTNLFGKTGFVCKNQSIISKYGFIALGANCGTKF